MDENEELSANILNEKITALADNEDIDLGDRIMELEDIQSHLAIEITRLEKEEQDLEDSEEEAQEKEERDGIEDDDDEKDSGVDNGEGDDADEHNDFN